MTRAIQEFSYDRLVVTKEEAPSHLSHSSNMSSMNTVRRLPNTVLRHEGSSSSLTLPSVTPATTQQIVNIAQELMNSAIEENKSKAAETSEVSNALKPGVTLDFSHKGIQKEFPEEVIDIIKVELERFVNARSILISRNPTDTQGMAGLPCRTTRSRHFQ